MHLRSGKKKADGWGSWPSNHRLRCIAVDRCCLMLTIPERSLRLQSLQGIWSAMMYNSEAILSRKYLAVNDYLCSEYQSFVARDVPRTSRAEEQDC
jgi:hypothetical protein